ncbi:hypothetical protein FRC11_009891 [Ceratobasidium sp. 423]|nr:hypothetical protein FRC11_009891 [Ceratobasidium sp. 423]
MYRQPYGPYELTSTHGGAQRRWTGSNTDKYEAAEEVVATFKQARINSCVFGSLAFKLLGVDCKPNDVDIIVLNTTKSLEDLKEYLVDEHPGSSFYLTPSRDPIHPGNHRLVWYATQRGARVKVDILQPGEMSIPRFRPTLITEETPPGRAGQGFSIPVAPLELVLLLKLQGWEAHYNSDRPDRQMKEYEDVNQIRALLIMYKYQFDFDYLPYDFIDLAEGHVQEYVEEYPSSIGSWRYLGLYH